MTKLGDFRKISTTAFASSKTKDTRPDNNKGKFCIEREKGCQVVTAL